MKPMDDREKHIMSNTRRIMFDQLEQVTANGDINMNEFDVISKILDDLKDIWTTCAMDESSYEEMEHGRYYDQTRMPYYDPSYTDGMIMHNRNGYSGNMRYNSGSYHMNRGNTMRHSDGTDYSRTRVMNHLEKMLDAAETDEERKMITRWMNEA